MRFHNYPRRILNVSSRCGRPQTRFPPWYWPGDFWQLPGINPSKATDSPRWAMVHQIELYQMWRCKDETLKAKLQVLRTAIPSKKQLQKICHGHKAWSGHKEPTAWDLTELYRKHPTTIIATCTRRGAATVNDLAIWVLFTTRKKRALAELPVDWEANPDNYDQDNAINTFKYVMSDGLRCFLKPAGSVGVSSLCCKCVCY